MIKDMDKTRVRRTSTDMNKKERMWKNREEKERNKEGKIWRRRLCR